MKHFINPYKKLTLNDIKQIIENNAMLQLSEEAKKPLLIVVNI